MKLSTQLILAALGAAVAAAREITPALIAECGSAENVMPVPNGANEAEYRHCVTHPRGDARAAVMQARDSDLGKMAKRALLDKRACWFGDDTGCTDGFCWRKCNGFSSGNWCWTAHGSDGKGDWVSCSSGNQCLPTFTGSDGLVYKECGRAKEKPCPDCGCDCRAKNAYKG